MIGGGGEPEQHQEQATELEHDHDGHFAWYHEHMIPLWCGMLTTIGLVAVAVIASKRRKG